MRQALHSAKRPVRARTQQTAAYCSNVVSATVRTDTGSLFPNEKVEVSTSVIFGLWHQHRAEANLVRHDLFERFLSRNQRALLDASSYFGEHTEGHGLRAGRETDANGGRALTAALTATEMARAGFWPVFQTWGGYPQDPVGGQSCL